MSPIYSREFLDDVDLEPADDSTGPGASWYLPCKVVADSAVAVVLLVLTAPLILLLMILVKVTSRGPAIYRQLRVGRVGREYEIYKLRTMTHDCERQTGPQWAKAKDPRVTSFGRFLRRSHLDELPQLWNVIRGDMSLVGPRPERPEFVAKLEGQVDGYRDRLAVRPGITGLAQVQLPADETLDDVRRKVRCDLCYVREMSPWLDFRILLGTALKIAGFRFSATRQLLALPGVLSRRPDRDSPEPSAVTQLQSI